MDTQDRDSKSPSPGSPSKPSEEQGGNAQVRTKRKKARVACGNCQRSHTTCDDGRPCNRCIQRGIQDSCVDGIRKKAKYLQDTNTQIQTRPSQQHSHLPHLLSGQNQTILQQQEQSPHQNLTITQNPFNATVLSGSLNLPSATQQQSPHTISQSQSSSIFSEIESQFLLQEINAEDFSTYADAEHHWLRVIGTQYGINPAGTGAATPDNASVGSQDKVHGYSPTQTFLQYPGNSGDMMDSWTNQSRSNSTGGNIGTFTIAAAGPGSIATCSPSPPAPSPQLHNQQLGGQESPTMGGAGIYNRQAQSSHKLDPHHRHSLSQSAQASNSHPQRQPNQQPQTHPPRGRRPNDPSQVYALVTKAYPYPEAFHRLFGMMSKRLSKESNKRISRAFTLFRPSFISCMQSLSQADLIFMEQTLQRTVFEYEKYIHSGSTPTLVCRRTGEIVVVGKEFYLLTGWSKNVLLGYEPNLNINVPQKRVDSEAQPQSFNGNVPPRDASRTSAPQSQESKPVFLPELLTEESAVDFWITFADLAFGDSRGSATTTCEILRYVPTQKQVAGQNGGRGDSIGEAKESSKEHDLNDSNADGAMETDSRGGNSDVTNGKSNRINSKDSAASKPLDGAVTVKPAGKIGDVIPCGLCWTIKRDPFDIPMLIVFNFLPIFAGMEVKRKAKTGSYHSSHHFHHSHGHGKPVDPAGGGGGLGIKREWAKAA